MTLFNSLKKTQLILVVLLITISVFFRFWDLRDYVVFLGDEGRDMIIMRKIFTLQELPFLGPTASVGGFYLGPIYYWMAAPFLALWRFDPAGPSYFVAAIGVATVFLLYKFLKGAIGSGPAFLVSFLYAIAPLIVRYSRSSWNPNPLPFFSLLLIYFLYLAINRKKWRHFLLAGASFGIVIQLHYLASILIAIFTAIVAVNTSFKKWPFISLLFVLGSLITFSPFLLFELRHNFPNFRTILEFTTRGTTLGYQGTNFMWLASSLGNIFLEEISSIKGTILTRIAFWVLTIGGLFGFIKYYKDSSKRLIFSIGLIWFIGGLLGLRFYTGQIYDYYFEFMFPAPFLLLGLVLSLIWQKLVLRVVSILTVLAISIVFMGNGFYKSPPNKLIDQTEKIADFVIEKSENQSFNFALISDHNSDHAYRYFLEIKKHPPVELETQITNQLLIVCESQKCAPLGHPLWEIAGFGRAEIKGEWDLPQYGFKVFRLTHWPGVESPAGRPAIKGV